MSNTNSPSNEILSIGRAQALFVCSGMVGVELVAPAFGYPIAWTRTAFTLALAVPLFLGYTWARWTVAVLIALGVIYSLVLVAFRPSGPAHLWYLGFLLLFDILAFYLLVFSDSLGSFLRQQRRP